MAGIEKVCEWGKDGHWYEGTGWYDEKGNWIDFIGPPTEDSFMPYDENGKSIYLDTVQLCNFHKKKFREAVKGKKHIIYVQPLTYEWEDRWKSYGWYPKDIRDFTLKVEGFDTGYEEEGNLRRWFHDFRRFKRNMKSLLGVSQLNIRFKPSMVEQDSYSELLIRRGCNTQYIAPKRPVEVPTHWNGTITAKTNVEGLKWRTEDIEEPKENPDLSEFLDAFTELEDLT